MVCRDGFHADASRGSHGSSAGAGMVGPKGYVLCTLTLCFVLSNCRNTFLLDFGSPVCCYTRVPVSARLLRHRQFFFFTFSSRSFSNGRQYLFSRIFVFYSPLTLLLQLLCLMSVQSTSTKSSKICRIMFGSSTVSVSGLYPYHLIKYLISCRSRPVCLCGI